MIVNVIVHEAKAEYDRATDVSKKALPSGGYRQMLENNAFMS
jgi:hypothetical protein